jgi:hypothetical protein
MQPPPLPPPQQTRQEIFRERVVDFGNKLYAEWEPRMLDEIAAAANTSEGVSGEDIKRFGPFINQMMARIFGLGVTAAVKAYPEFLGDIMAPLTRRDLRTVPNA